MPSLTNDDLLQGIYAGGLVEEGCDLLRGQLLRWQGSWWHSQPTSRALALLALGAQLLLLLSNAQ